MSTDDQWKGLGQIYKEAYFFPNTRLGQSYILILGKISRLIIYQFFFIC